MSSLLSRERERLIRKGADDEFTRLEPRIKKLKLAVEERGDKLNSMAKEMRALRADVDRLKASSGDLGALEASARADANLMSELRAQALKDAGTLNELCQRVNRAAEETESWMHWAWVGQPDSPSDAENAVYQAKISTLENAVKYWSSRARKECPANTQAVADRDAAVDFSCRHLRLDDILRFMEPM
tara:strand:+ start:210 stop:770 length:561 start_codon:yes stop_codon:yes gene_type:complete